MTIQVSLQLVPQEPLQDATASPKDERAKLTDRVLGAYQTVVENFETELRALPADAELPQLSAVLYLEDGEQTVQLDGQLLTVMIESFVLDGWAGIERLQAALYAVAPESTPPEYSAPSGGVRADAAHVWTILRRFFDTTRNLLAMLVHEALVDIELKVAPRVRERLQRSLDAIRAAKNGPLRQSEWSRVQGGEFSLADRKLAKSLFPQLTELVRQFELARELAQRIPEYATSPPERGQEAAEGGSGSSSSPTRSERAAETRNTELAYVQAQRAIDTVGVLIEGMAPLALLAAGKLKPGFTQPQMEATIYAELIGRETLCTKLIEPFFAGTSRVAATWQRPVLDESPTAAQLDAIASWQIPPSGLVVAAAQQALRGITPPFADSAWLALAREDLLVQEYDDTLDSGSLFYSVCFHYIAAWDEAVSAAHARENALTSACTRVGQVVAAFGLFGTRSPFVATQLRSWLTRLLLLGITSFSFERGLSQFDEAIQAEILSADPVSRRALAEGAQIERESNKFAEEFAVRFLIDTVLSGIGDKWSLVGKVVRVRDYYQDAEGLLAELHHG